MRCLWQRLLAVTVLVAITCLLPRPSEAVSLTRHTALLMNEELSVTVKWVSDAPVTALHVVAGQEDKLVSVDSALSRRQGEGFEGKGSFSVPVNLASIEQFLPYSITLEDSQGGMSNKVSGRVRLKPAASRAVGAEVNVPGLGLVRVKLPGGNQVSFSSIATDDKGLYEISFRIYDAAGNQVKQQVLRNLGKHWEGSTEAFALKNGSYSVVARAVDSSGNASLEQRSRFDLYDVPKIAVFQGGAATRSLGGEPPPANKILLKLPPEAYAKLKLEGELPPEDSYELEISCGNDCPDLQAQAERIARSLGATIISADESAASTRSILATEQIVVSKETLSRAIEGAAGDPAEVLTINITCGGWCKAIKKVGEAVLAIFEAVTRSGGATLAPPVLLPAGNQSEESRSLSKKLVEGKSYAVVVGINDYKHINKLKNAVSDATVMDQVLREHYGFETTLLTDAQATRDGIMTSLNDLRKKLTENDSLVIFYSGHGEYNKETETSYWLPVDAAFDDNTKWLETRAISDQLKLLSAKHVLIIADSCFSGTMTRATNTALTGNNTRERYLNKLFEKPSRVLIASGGNEPVTDAGGKGHSIFSDVLITALKEPFQEVFTAEELMTRHLKESVAGRTEQTPEYKIIRNSGHDGGDFIFVKRK